MPRARPNGKTLVLEVIEAFHLETDGTTTARYQVIPLPALEMHGPCLESIQVMTMTSNRTTNHQWKGVLEYSGDDRNWYPATPVDLCAWVMDEGQVVHPRVTDSTLFSAPYVRFSLASANATGTSRESATVSLWLMLTKQT